MTQQGKIHSVSLKVVLLALIATLVCGILIGYLVLGQIGQLVGKGGQSSGKEVTLSGSVSMPLCDSPTNIVFRGNNSQTFTYTYTGPVRPFNYSIQLTNKASYSVTINYLDTCGGGGGHCSSYVIASGNTKRDFSC